MVPLGLVVVVGCTTGCGDNARPDDAGIPAWPLTVTLDRSAVRVASTPDHVIWLEETLAGIGRYAPGPRRMRTVDRRSFAETVWEPAAPARIADAVVHPSGSVSVALVGDDYRLTLVRLDRGLVVISQTPVVDPEIAGDPPIVPGMPATELLINGLTAEAVRLAALGEDTLVAALTAQNSLIAYRMQHTGEQFAMTWRRLIEPAVALEPVLPTGGSYDTFGAIAAWFRPSLAVDPAGHSYLAVWAAEVRVLAHNTAFREQLTPLFTGPGESDSDVLITKLDGTGARQWTRVIGARYEDEPYALAAENERIAIAGRSRRNPGRDHSQWDPWLAVLDPAGQVLASRALPFDASGILLAIDLDERGRIAAGGSDGWTQSPDGLSIVSDGHKLLFTLEGPGAVPQRIALEPGPRHSELRSVELIADGIWFAGHQDGPLTHSGDADPQQIRATGVVGFVPSAPL